MNEEIYLLRNEVNNSNIKKEGLAIFLVNDKSDEKISYHYNEYIPIKYFNHESISHSILRLRNILIYMTFFEILSSIWGLSYYFIRRSPIYIYTNVFAFFLSLIGILSVINVNEVGLIIYTILTTSLPGSFFVFQLVELFTLEHKNTHNSLNDNVMMMIFSLPYIYDFIVGIFCFVLIYRIAIFNDAMRQINQAEKKVSYDRVNNEVEEIKKIDINYERILLQRNNGLNRIECIVCLENQRNIILIPCKHLVMCSECYDKYTLHLYMHHAKCPVCRTRIENMEKVYL